MITVHWWLLLPISLASFAVGFSVRAFIHARSAELSAQRHLDRLLDKETRLPPLNPQKAEDIAGGSTLKSGPTDG